MIAVRWICLSLTAALCLAAAPASARDDGAPQQTFSSAKAKSSVPVTPKQTISSKNRKAGMVFDDKGAVKTRKLTNEKLSKTRSKTSGKTAQ